MRNLKYPLTSRVADAVGNLSDIYAMVYALEKWAYRHGYSGYSKHRKQKRKFNKSQTKMKFE